MPKTDLELTRRRFLQSSLAAVGTAAMTRSMDPALQSADNSATQQAPAKYTRYNITSEQGEKALVSYARAIDKMLRLPADHPQNWFRNAFIHFMDCPHGNWWFYAWHRGYLGYFEETIRSLSGDSTFAIPYWDWTTLPEIPKIMFDGPLNPTFAAFEPYTRNLDVFTKFVRPALESYWNSLNAAQREQLNIRGYPKFQDMWNDVTGYSSNQKGGVTANVAFAPTCAARYLTRDNPKLNAKTAQCVSPGEVCSGLAAPYFYDPNYAQSFNSTKTPSHNTAPGGPGSFFSILEGSPHNNIHNYIAGVGNLDPGPYGNMANNLSSVDPIFFLHHSNMDRLWDVWTRIRQRSGKPYMPTPAIMETWAKEPFLFFVNGKGQYVGASQAGDYLSTQRFNYDYQPGFPDTQPQPCQRLERTRISPPLKGSVKGNTASVVIPTEAIRNHLASEEPLLVAEVTIPYPSPTSSYRAFDIIVGAPPDVTQVDADSPYYAGTVAFFGGMNMPHMDGASTFIVPLEKKPEAFKLTEGAKTTSLNIRVSPAYGEEPAPAIKAVTVQVF